MESDDGTLVGGIVGGVVAVVLLLGVVAGLLLWRLKRADKPETSDVALKPATHYIPHAADFKVEEGPRYDSLSTDEASATLPVGRDHEAAAPATSLRKAKANSKSTDTEPIPSHLAGLSQRSSKVGSEFSSARAETWVIDASDLELGSVIGQGAFGVVRRAEWRGRTVAVKQIKKSTIGDDKAVADFEGAWRHCQCTRMWCDCLASWSWQTATLARWSSFVRKARWSTRCTARRHASFLAPNCCRSHTTLHVV
jgi:hypothetical protein